MATALDLSGEMRVWTWDEIRQRFLRSYQAVTPGADISDKSQANNDARTAADMQLVLHANVRKIGDTSSLRSRKDSQLDEIGEREKVPRPPAVGASGYVVASTADGGSTIYRGDEIKVKNGSARFVCAITALYANGANVPVVGVDVGPGTNLGAGTKMQWSNPRNGCSAEAVVWSEGLTGGRDEATDDEYAALIEERRGNPAVAGNDAAYQAFVENPFNTGIAVQKCFSYPALKGTGTTVIPFLLRPIVPGGSRVPSQAQVAIMGAGLENAFGATDGIFLALVAEQPATVQFQASWRKAAAGWADAGPWPAYLPGTPILVSGAVAITSSAMRVGTTGTADAPLPGQTIALYDPTSLKDPPAFRKKRIQTVTEVLSGKTWDLTFDMTAGASDPFVPAAGALVSPWSDSLGLIVPAVTGYFDVMGPGELVSTFYDPGRRQRRQPEDPESWTSKISNRLDALVQAVSAVRSATLVSPGSTESTTVGVPPSLVYVRRLTDIACYPED